MTEDVQNNTRITPDQARWRCDPAKLGFVSTADLAPEERILGQEDAVEALQFGLETRLQGNNVFVRGLSGFGRMGLIHQVIAEMADPEVDLPDLCYVNNFAAPDQPRLLELPTGRGKDFSDTMDRFAEFTQSDLPEHLNSDYVKARQKQQVAATQERIKEIGQPFEEDLAAANLAMVPLQVGQGMVPVILPIIDNKPVQFEELQQMVREGKISEAQFNSMVERIGEFEKQFASLGEQIEDVQIEHQEALQRIVVEEAESFVQSRINAIRHRFRIPEVEAFLEEVKTDLIQHRLTDPETAKDFVRAYRVNLIRGRKLVDAAPVVPLTNPSLNNLVGKIDREMAPNGMVMRSDHLMIKPGALLDADGGYLIIEAQDVLSEPGSWAALLRTLKNGSLEVTSHDLFSAWGTPQLRPEAIAIDVKVVLVGDPETYHLLDMYEPRFATLFKVLADFTDTIERNDAGFNAYANVIARLIARDGLKHFAASGIARLIEHGARICAQSGRLTSRFGRIADIAREASYLANEAKVELVDDSHVIDAIARSKRRADLPARRFRRLLSEGTLKIDVAGECVGQVNGLAVTSAGPLMYGFPSRITASIGPGTAGAVNIERESDLSGSVHTKGFMILSGLLRHLLRLKHPMAFSAAIAFEQTYGGIDGDSASGVEFCCLISALTGLPARQDLAMTGAVDQKGNILPIGGVTEKVEGFFDACQATNFTGTQGVIIPESNADELMLRDDVVAAIADSSFSVYSISSIDEALALMLGKDAGKLHDSAYDAGSVLALAQEKAHEYWEVAIEARKKT